MVISDAINLVEFVRGCITRKGEADKAYFEQFVLPAWEAFNRVHENYKASFKEYVNLLSEEMEIEDLVERIRDDSIYTRDLRFKLLVMVKSIPSKRKPDHLLEFANAIVEYFDVRNGLTIHTLPGYPGVAKQIGYEALLKAPFQGNLPRFEATVYLLRIGEQDNIEKRKKMLNDIFARLQNRYTKVVDCYFRLRAASLK